MAGGMSKRGAWGSMSDRVQQGSRPPAPAPPAPPAAPAPPAPPSTLKHCWVAEGSGRVPALLLEWRRVEAGFQGRVVRPVLEDGAWILVEEWLPAALLEPA